MLKQRLLRRRNKNNIETNVIRRRSNYSLIRLHNKPNLATFSYEKEYYNISDTFTSDKLLSEYNMNTLLIALNNCTPPTPRRGNIAM